MNALRLCPVRLAPAEDWDSLTVPELGVSPCEFRLAVLGGSLRQAADGDEVLGRLICRRAGGRCSWFLVDARPALGLNGRTPLFRLAYVEPGALLSLGDRFWFVA